MRANFGITLPRLRGRAGWGRLMPEKIVLAYSGGLDTTVAVKWLTETRGFDVIALTVDLGSQPNLKAIRERALAAGAVGAYVVDARQPFIERFCWQALKACAM